MAEITPAQRLGVGEDGEEMIVALWDQVHNAGADKVAALTRPMTEKDMKRMAKEGLLHPDAAAFLAAGEATAGASEELMLRRMAAAEHLVHPATAAFLGYIASETDALLARGAAMPAGELALAPEVEGMAARAEESLAAIAGRLRRGAVELFAGDEAVVAALHRHADIADAARATVEAFTASVRRFRAAAGSARPPPAIATETGCYLRPQFRAAGSALPPTGTETGTGCSFRPKL
ncbi:unnamed protein product [Urochloa humidicola]